MGVKFSILITTYNRVSELHFTLQRIEKFVNLKNVECIICDDGSNDGTYEFIKSNYQKIKLIKNEKSKGLIYSRNRLLKLTTAKYAISLDDDAHFLSNNVIENIEKHFTENPKCGVGAFRIFWGTENPSSINSIEKSERVKGFVGCGHVWNMEAWHSIPDYPNWFVFYGEEEFASYQLFKKKWEVHYLPQVLVHHRVNIKKRKKHKDYQLRLRRSLRAGWYLYGIFYPKRIIPKRILYSIWIQLKLKVFKGDFKALFAIFQALGDSFWNFPKIVKVSNRFSDKEFESFQQLNETKLYWIPKK